MLQISQSGEEFRDRDAGRRLEDAQHRRGAIEGKVSKWQFTLRWRQVVQGRRQDVVNVQAEGVREQSLRRFACLLYTSPSPRDS